jgi:methyl-accepting chemotaxis protein
MADIWWEIYKKFFMNMRMKQKLLLGYLILALPPAFLLLVATLVFVPSGTFKNLFLLLDLLGMIAVIFIAYIFSRNLTIQISQLTSGAKEIARGNLHHKLEVEESADEIGELAQATKKMVGSLVDSLEATKSIINGIGEALYLTDENLVVTHWNPAATRLLGYSAEEIIGKHCYEFTDYVGIEAACHTPNCSSKKVMRGEADFLTREVVLRAKNGEEIPVKISTSPLKDAQGNCVGAIKLATDLRPVKEKEKEIIEVKEYLERQVDRLLPVVTAAAEGDLTHEITAERDDAIGRLINGFNSMLASLRELIAEVKKAANTVATTSENLAATGEEMNATTQEISSSVQQIAQGAQEQVQQMNVASREMKKIAEMAQSIAKGAQAAAQVAEEANAKAQEGGEAAKQAIKKMRETTEVVDQTAAAIKELGERSRKIVEIVDLITNIAEQTNLLALNAAIEAARAGEHGRGFAVVAEEVRKLAEGSGKAAEQIGTIIREIQADVEESVKLMDASSKEVSDAAEVVNRALGALESILNSVEDLTSKVGEISAATDEQSMASEKVVKAIDDIAAAAEEAAAGSQQSSAATEEQTASMEEMTAAAQELADLASKLKEMVGKFKVEKED